MKKVYKNIALATTAFTLVAGYAYFGIGNKVSVTSTQYQATKSVNKTLTSSKTTTYNADSIVPFLSNIVIYNSHPDENYPSGKKVTDVGALLNNKLNEKGLISTFIKTTAPKEYLKSYDVTRKLITENVKEYNNTILLDISRNLFQNSNDKALTKNILIILAKSNPHYAENKKFANSLISEFNKIKQPSSIYEYKTGISYFNQDLSNRGIFIEIGNIQSSDTEINQAINSVATALQNIQQK